VNQLPKSVVRESHATFCGNRGRATASGDPVGDEQSPFSNRDAKGKHKVIAQQHDFFPLKPFP
jgi:hypothetical protein